MTPDQQEQNLLLRRLQDDLAVAIALLEKPERPTQQEVLAVLGVLRMAIKDIHENTSDEGL